MNKNVRTFSLTSRKFQIKLFGILFFGLIFSFQHAQSQTISATDRVDIAENSAIVSPGNGVLIKWQTSFEQGIVGFNIYRAENNKKVLLNQSLVPGSYFVVGQNQPFEDKRDYSWFDQKGSVSSEYFIESITYNNLNQTFSANKIVVQTNFTTDEIKAAANSTVLNNMQRDVVSATSSSNARMVAAATFNAASTSVFDIQRTIAATPGVKISVRRDGVYRVNYQDLVNANFDLSTSTLNWQLYVDGVEQPLIMTGVNNADGTLTAQGYFEFYGRQLDTTYTDAHVYYLINGSAAGKRIYPRIWRPRSLTGIATTMSATVENKPRNGYFNRITNGETSNFFGGVYNSSPANLTLNLSNINGGATQAVVNVSIQGLANTIHQTTVLLNNTQIGVINGSNFDGARANFTVSAALINNGPNTIKLISSASNDINCVDYIRINYLRDVQAVNNQISLRTPLNSPMQINGFTTAGMRVLDTTDVNNPNFVGTRVQVANGLYNVTVPAMRYRTLYAFTSSNVLTPDSIAPNAPSNVYDNTRSKDLVIVTHSNWQAQAQALADYRTSQGLSVAVVNIEDVFDEFSYGASTPQAIKDFFQVAQPRYAILFGDASVDGRNYTNNGFNNFVPSVFTDTVYGEIVSDELLADFNNDSIADFPVGRIPVRSAAEAQLIVNKIINFEQQIANTNPMSRGVLFVSDDPIDYDFFAQNQSLSQQLSSGTPFEFVKRSDGTPATVRATVLNRINQGPFIVNFTGHGSPLGWTAANLLSSNSAPSLTNSDKLSLFISLTCLNGSFAGIGGDGLSEAILKAPNGGAAAYWASSAETVAFGQNDMSLEFYRQYRLAASGVKLGDLTKMGRAATTDVDVRKSWVLLGDPTMKVK